MAKNDTTTRFNADISELKSAFQEASRQIKLANSEFKAASSGMENWNKSADGVTAKISQLDKVLDAQKKQLKSLNDQYELTVKEYGENSAAAENLKIKINNQQAAINATQQQINSYNQQLQNMQSQAQKSESAAEKLRDEIKNQEKNLSDLKDKYASVVLEQGRESDEAKALANQIDSLSNSLNDNRNKLKDAENAANEFDNSLNNSAKATEESKSAFEKLHDEIKNQEQDLSKLKSEYASVVLEQGRESDEAKALANQIDSLSNSLNDNRNKLKDAENAANEFDKSVNKANETAEESKSASEKLRDEIKNQEKNLSDLKDKYASVVLEQGRESDEAKALANQIGSLSGSLNDNRDKLKDVESAANEFDKSINKANETAEESKSASEKLRDEIKNQEKNLSDLKDKYASVVLEQGRESDEAKALANQINNLSDNLNDNRNRLENAEYAAGEFDGTLEKTDETVRDTSDGFTVMKGVLADLISAGIQAAIQGFKDLAKYAKESYDEYHSGMNNVITATGATGEAVQGLAESYKNTAKSVKGDMSEIGSTLGEVNTRFGYTGEQLEKTTEDFMKFADITGTDAVSAVQLVSRAMGDAGIESDKYGEVLDELAIAAQASGISVDKLTENLTKYGAPMRALGFDTKESISIFSAWEKAGVNTEIAFSGMKKAISNWSAAGKDSKEEFKKTLDEIAKAPDIAAATTKAIEIFGAKAGPDLADAIQNGRFEFSEFLDILKNSDGTVENTYNATQDAFDNIALAAQGLKIEIGEQFSNLLSEYEPEIKQAVEAVKGFISNGISFLTTEVIPKIKDFKDKISQFLSEHEPEIKQFTDTIKGYISTAIDFIKTEIIPRIEDFVSWCIEHLPLIEAAIGAIAAAFVAFKAVTFIQSAITAFQALATVIQAVGVKQAILNAIMAANPVGLIVAAIAGLVAAFVILWNNSEAFRNFWIGLWDSIQETLYSFFDFFVNSWNNLKLVLIAVIGFFISLLDSFKDSVVAGWQMIGDFFVNLWNNLKLTLIAVIAYFISLLDGFKDSVVAGWQMIGDFFVNSWEGIKAIFALAADWFNETIIIPVSTFFSSMWDNLVTGATLAWEGIKTVFSVITEWFGNKFTEAWTAVKNVFSVGGKIFDGIKEGITSAFTTVVNAIIRGINKVVSIPFNAINRVLDRLRNLSIMDIQPFSWISDISVPKIPELREGGVLRKGKVGFLEGDGDEAVVPLEKNTRWIDEVSARISRNIGTSTQYNSSVDSHAVTNNFYQTNNSPKALSRLEIYRQSKNLMKTLG